jgi:hypothetical protein
MLRYTIRVTAMTIGCDVPLKSSQEVALSDLSIAPPTTQSPPPDSFQHPVTQVVGRRIRMQCIEG